MRFFLTACLLLLLVLPQAGCQTLREVASLRTVAFALDRVSEAQLAGVNIQSIQNYESLSAGDLLRLGAAVAQQQLPLDFSLHVRAENPEANQVDARLLKFDWTLLIDDKETISGIFDQNLVLPPGSPVDLAIPMRIDLVQFFDQGARDLIELALAVSGQGGAPKRIKLQAIPTIDTPLGPIRYPNAITIVGASVGS